MITANGKNFLLFELRLELIPQDPNGQKSLAQRTKQMVGDSRILFKFLKTLSLEHM